MLDLADEGVGDQHELEALLARRFGDAERARLMELYREHWITDADFARIKSFGMNLVRLPFEYRLLEDDTQPMREPDAWRWLDRAVEMAEAQGIYIILDLHGAAGRQSGMDHTGRSGQNKLWSDADNQARTVWLWKQIANRYRNRPAVAAYDLLNEPWGGTHEQLSSMVTRLFNAVREVDEETIVVLPGNYDGIDLYGDPRDDGWKNYIFTTALEPGVLWLGWAHSCHVHKDFLNGGIPDWGRKMKALETPLLVGEFNVVHKQAGRRRDDERRHFDAFEDLGWPVYPVAQQSTYPVWRNWIRNLGNGDQHPHPSSRPWTCRARQEP